MRRYKVERRKGETEKRLFDQEPDYEEKKFLENVLEIFLEIFLEIPYTRKL